MLERRHLESFLQVVEFGSVLAASRRTGHSRASYERHLKELEAELGAHGLIMERAPGQKLARLTPAGEALAQRAREILRQWDLWVVATRDAVGRREPTLRLGALAGSFDLLADLFAELAKDPSSPPLKLVEYPSDRLTDGVSLGEVDLAIGTQDPENVPADLLFTAFGPLRWAVIAPSSFDERLPHRLRCGDLRTVPLVLPRAGVLRDRLERHLGAHGFDSLSKAAVVEVESTPRMVDMVARGFGAAIVSQFRLAFLPPGVTARPLMDGPPPLIAGALKRRSVRLPKPARVLLDRARRRFRELTRLPPTES